MNRTADVVVVGGGVVGASIAYHLTDAGCRDVLVLERECVQGFGSTGRATGGVRAQFSHPADIRMSLASLEFFRSFKDALGVDPQYRPNGYLFLATDERQLEAMRRRVETQQREGLREARLVTPREIRERAPWLFAEDVAGGSFCSVDGFIEPLRLLQGFTERAADRGARVELDSEVREIRVEKGAVSGVVTARETISTRCVVNAAGPWARHVAAMAGVELRLEPLRRQVAGTLALPGLPEDAPMVIEAGSGFHFRKDHSGGGGALLLWNDPKEPVGENLAFDRGWLARMLPMARRRLPLLKGAPVSARRCWAGLYEMTPDHHPVLGRVPGLSGFYLANGFSGHGVMHSPVTGRVIAELVTRGTTDLVDVSAFAVERFAEGRLFEDEGEL